MISVVEELRNIVTEELIYAQDSGTTITLEEKSLSKCKPIELQKGNTKTLTIEVDKEGLDVHPLLKKGVKNLKKVPDYIIFCENKKVANDLYILIIELKSDNKDDWHRQAKAGLALAQYLVEMLEGYKKMVFPNIEYRCLLFHTRNESKGMPKKKASSQQKFEYDTHDIFKYLFVDKPCNVKTPYLLERFLK